MNARIRWLMAMAAGVGAWSGWIVLHRDVDARTVAEPVRSAPRPAAGSPSAADRVEPSFAPPRPGSARQMALGAPGNAFEPRDWAPPPPPPPPPPPAPAAPPPPPPAAPAPPAPPQLPYRLVGVMEAGLSPTPKVFLSLNDKLLIAAPGDTLEGGFRLDSISARELVFTHLQLNLQLRLSVQGASS